MPSNPIRQGDVISRLSVEQGHVVNKQWQPSRRPILEQNQALQREPEALQDPDWANWQLSIPEVDYRKLIRKYPDLNSPDPGILRNAWRKFLASDESDPYRVKARSRARA